MSWFSRSNISSLTGQWTEQLSSFAREVVTEEEGSNEETFEAGNDLAVACKRIEELEKTAAKLREETIRYQKASTVNEQKVRNYEQEIDRISKEHIEAIEEKEFIIKHLQKQVRELQSSRSNLSETSDSKFDRNSNSAWSNFDWQETQPESQDLFGFSVQTSNLPEASELDERILNLEQENDRLQIELKTLETFYKEKIETLQTENESYQESISDLESKIQTEIPTETSTNTESLDKLSSNFAQTDDVIFPDDFNPATHDSLEHYSCTVIRDKFPLLARALSEMILENHDLKQAITSENEPSSQHHEHHMPMTESELEQQPPPRLPVTSGAECEREGSNSGGGSSVDSTSSWHLISSQSNKATPIITTASSPISGGSKPCSPVQAQLINRDQQTDSDWIGQLEKTSQIITESGDQTELDIPKQSDDVSPSIYISLLNINSLNELVKNSDSLGDDLKQLLQDVNLESLLEEASQIQEHNVLLLSQKLLQFRQESTLELQKVSEQLILLQESHAKLQSDDSKQQLDLDNLTSENSRLQTRLQELSTALELADEQLQKIDFSEVNSLNQQFNRNDHSNNRSESSDTEDLKQTQFLLEESLSSNLKMSSVMEDQKHELEVLQNNLSHLQKVNSELTSENESLKELTDELSGQIAESEKNLEKLRQEQIAAMQTSESADDRNNLALDRSRTPEFQLSIVTELQNEVLSLKKKLKKSKAASDRSSLSPEKARSSSNNASPSTPVSIATESVDSSILEQALLDKEEVIVKLNREIEGFKNTIADLYRENDSRFETQTELLSLKDQLIGLQNALEKQEDQIVDKDFTIEKLQQELEVKIEQHLEETNHFKTENDRLRIVCAEIEDREKTMQKNIEFLQQKISEANSKYDKFMKNLREMITNVFPVLVQDGLNLGEAEILTNLAQIVGNVIQENEKLKSILQSESDEKDQSIIKISELNLDLKSVKNDLESERNANSALREQVQEMMNKLVNVTNETNDYGLRLKQVSEKLASSIHEKCDLNSKLSNLLQERDILLQSIEKLRVEKESLLAEIDKLKLQLTECKDICEKLTIEIELLVSKNCEISDEISRETAILHDDYTAKSESLNSEMRELKSQMRQLENELKSSEDSKQEVSNELLTKENELAKVNSDLKSVYAELETIFNTNDCNEISLIVTWMKNEVKRLEDEISSKDAKIDYFDAKIENLKDELQTRDKEIRSKDYKEKRLERDIEEYKIKIQNFSDKNEYLQDECNLLTERNETLAGTIAQLENYLQISEKKLSETLSGDWEQRFVKECETVSTQKSQISELRNLVEGYESQLNEALEDYESLKQRYTAVSERVSGNDLAFKEEIASLKERISTITSEKLHLNSQVEDSKQQISTLSRQLKELYLKVQNFEVVVNDKDDLIASLNEKLISSNEKLAQSESSLLSIEKQFSEKINENQEFVTNKADLKAKIDELNNEVEKLKSKNEALSEILNENETGWNQKFQKQQEDFETYAQQAYQVRAHYDQLLYAYNEKTQQNSDLEKTVESLKEENSKLEERLIDASSMAPVAFNETQISTESEQKLTSSYPPDLLQVSSSNDLKSASEVLQREINSKDEQISKLKTERSQLQEVIAEKNSEIESLTSKSAEINDQLTKKGIEIKEFSAKNEKLSTELVRLREHMLKIEEGYTQEALAAEEREKNLRTKLYQVEENLQRVTSTSNVIDSELLTKMSEQEAQLFEVTSRSKQTEVQLRDMTQQMNLYKDASQNLQLVLENFHKEQEREKRLSEETFEKQVSSVNEQKQQLESKLKKLNSKLDKQQELLEQAAHLSSEMELREEEIERLRGEVDLQMVQVSKWKKKAQEASGSGVVGERVEKQLVRNLLVAYLTVPNSKKSDALNMIARFLEFSEQERNKVGINAQRGWFSGWMPSANNNATQAKGGSQPTDSASQQQDSFTQKFIEFLESESSKPNVVSLPHHHLNPQSTGELSIETGFSKPPLGAPSSISKSKYPSTGSRGGGFNPFSPTVLPQLRPQHSPSVSLSGGSISSLEDEPSFTSRLRQEDSFTPRQNRSRNSSSNSSSHHNSVQGTTASTPKMYPSSSGGPNAQNSSLDYSSDQSDTSSTVQFAHKRETSFLKDLLQEH